MIRDYSSILYADADNLRFFASLSYASFFPLIWEIPILNLTLLIPPTPTIMLQLLATALLSHSAMFCGEKHIPEDQPPFLTAAVRLRRYASLPLAPARIIDPETSQDIPAFNPFPFSPPPDFPAANWYIRTNQQPLFSRSTHPPSEWFVPPP